MKNKIFCIIMIVLGVVFLCSGIDYHYRGYHNVDLVYNVRSIGYNEGFSTAGWVDTYNTKGDTIKLDEGYSLGLKQMNYGLYLAIGGAFLLGLGFAYLE